MFGEQLIYMTPISQILDKLGLFKIFQIIKTPAAFKSGNLSLCDLLYPCHSLLPAILSVSPHHA